MTRKFKTLRRYDEAGHAHSLTFSCFQRRPFLSRERTCHWFCDAVAKAKEKHRFLIWAYVIMPEHVHMLVYPQEQEYDTAGFCASVKVPVARRAVNWVKRHAPESLGQMRDAQPNGVVHHRFWQRGGGYDRNITEPKTLLHQIDYIHANPVRRNLCGRPEEWFWSSAADYAGRSDGPIALDLEMLPNTPDG